MASGLGEDLDASGEVHPGGALGRAGEALRAGREDDLTGGRGEEDAGGEGTRSVRGISSERRCGAVVVGAR